MTWLETYHEYTKEHEAIKVFHEWAGLFCLSSALSGRCWTDLGFGRIFPNLYIILVGPPAKPRKSEAIKTACSLLEPLEEELLVWTSSESITYQKLFDDLQDTKTLIEIEGHPHEYMGLSAMSSELGSFVKRGEIDLINALIELYDGKGRHRHGTRGSGTVVLRNAALNILAATTPRFFEGFEFESHVRTGFTSRCLFLYAETRRFNKSNPTINLELKAQLVLGLRRITEFFGLIPLSPEADEYYQNWYEKLPLNPEVIPPLIPYYGRKQTHLRKVAMLCTVMDMLNGRVQVTEIEHIKKAEVIIERAEKYMIGAFAGAGESNELNAINKLIATLQMVPPPGWISRQEIMNKHYTEIPLDENVSGSIPRILGSLVTQMGVVEQRILLGGKLYYRWKGEKE